MTTEVLGKLSFKQIPDVNGSDVLINGGGVPAILSGITSSRPGAGTGDTGRLFLDTTTNKFYRDDGSNWIDLTPIPYINGTANEIDVTDATNVTPAVISIAQNPVIPGTASMTLPKGTTAERPTVSVDGMHRYNTTISASEYFNGSSWLPLGKVLQVVTGSLPSSSGTSTVPLDATTPLITEGTQLISVNFTPLSATSTITIRFNASVSHGTAARSIIFSCFANNVNIGSSIATCAVASSAYQITLQVAHLPASTATITFSLRAGANSTGTWYINRAGATNTLGGALVSEYTIMEIEA